MKQLIAICVTLCLISCNSNEKDTKVKAVKELEKPMSVAQKIANAHGFEHWNKVKSFAFTFGGSYDEPNSGRSWIWEPKTDQVSVTIDGETNTYNRSAIDSSSLNFDRAFINDKFWALIPFQLVWDEGITISDSTIEVAPISKDSLNKIVLLYSNEGGYTPGDAYDIYYNDQFIIKEWAFRKGNAEEASLVNTFEKHQDFNGLIIAQEHKRAEGDWNLLVWKIKVDLDD